MLIYLCGANIKPEKLMGNSKKTPPKSIWLEVRFHNMACKWQVVPPFFHHSNIRDDVQQALKKIKSRLNRLSIFLAFALNCKATKRPRMDSKKVTKSHIIIGESMTEIYCCRSWYFENYFHSKIVDSLPAWLSGKKDRIQPYSSLPGHEWT